MSITTVKSWAEMRDFGFVVLNEKPSRLPHRYVVDLTYPAYVTFCKCYGLTYIAEDRVFVKHISQRLVPPGFAWPWKADARHPHVCSVVLGLYDLTDLACVALLDQGCERVDVYHRSSFIYPYRLDDLVIGGSQADYNTEEHQLLRQNLDHMFVVMNTSNKSQPTLS